MSDLDHWCRETERKMTQAQMDRAVALVMAGGWTRGDRPPAFVWAQAFIQAMEEVPATTSPPR